MSGYDQPMRQVITPTLDTTRVGAVIVFRPGTDVAKAQRFLDSLADRDIIAETYAHAFDSNYGVPVWYVP